MQKMRLKSNGEYPAPHAAPHACPCGQGFFDQCCDPLLTGKASAATAAALMRSRYSAFASGNIDYLIHTHDMPPTPAQLRKSMKGVVWTRLVIDRIEHGGYGENHGVVAFRAFFSHRGVASVLPETSQFKRGSTGWIYVS